MATDDDADNDNAPMTEAEAIRHFATMQQAADDRAFFTDGELASVTTALERSASTTTGPPASRKSQEGPPTSTTSGGT